MTNPVPREQTNQARSGETVDERRSEAGTAVGGKGRHRASDRDRNRAFRTLGKRPFCQVCGYDDRPDVRWGDGDPLYVICPCCGSDSGVDDLSSDAAQRARQRWIGGSFVWHDESVSPPRIGTLDLNLSTCFGTFVERLGRVGRRGRRSNGRSPGRGQSRTTMTALTAAKSGVVLTAAKSGAALTAIKWVVFQTPAKCLFGFKRGWVLGGRGGFLMRRAGS